MGPALLVGCLVLLALAASAIAAPARHRAGGATDTKITSVKVGGEGTARFAFKGSGRPPLNFECALDKARFRGCHSPRAYRKLAAGHHRFRVRAVAADGSKDPTPAKVGFTIHGRPRDGTPPTATIDSGPSGPIADGRPAYSFHADETSSFECSVAFEPPAWFPCSSPYRPSAPLPDGAYAFRVRATDAAGNVGEPATRGFTVDTQGPTVTIQDGPVGTVSTGSATFKFGSADGGAKFFCRLDEDPAGFTACESPKSYTGLLGVGGANGSVPHVFEVKAVDAAGNVGAAAVHGWSVDREPPTMTITGGPSGPTNDASPKFEFTSSETATLLCRVRLESTGGGKFEQCSSPKEYGTPSPLADGLYVFEVRGIDTAGNEGPALGQKFQVDTIAPGVAIIAGPANGSTLSLNEAEFGFNSPDEFASFQCQLDAAAFAPCGGVGSGGVKYTSLAEGPHTFTLHAVDKAGNVSTASRGWTVDTTPPQLVIDSGPANPTSATSATFAFHATDASNVSFQCRLDGAGFAACSSPKEYSGLAHVAHVFDVRATDAAGNFSTVSYMWTIE